MPPAAPLPTLPLRADVLLSNALFEELSEGGLSEEFLRHHCGQEDLSKVETLELQVDATSQQVEGLGAMVPNLLELRMNQSSVPSVRDLGTGLSKLRVLWLCRSALQDLSGISALSSLEELYVSFNDIKEIYPLGTHESLQVLDLEGNLVEDFSEVQCLENVTSLRELNLSLNPFWKDAGVSRDRVLQALPQLEMLDDAPRERDADERQGAVLVDLDAGWDEGLPSGGQGAGDVEVRTLIAISAGLSPDSASAAEAAEEEDKGALRELMERAGRARAGVPCAAEAAQPPAVAGGFAGAGAGASPASGGALAQLRAGRAQLLTSTSTTVGGWRAGEQASSDGGAAAEPNEQDLVVEGLKRAPRPMPSVLTFRHAATSRGVDEGRLPRPPRTAWGWGSGSSSTSYRPSTRPSTASSTSATSSLVSSRGRGGDEPSAGSDLTLGDDGAPLVGNPLAAARRRRQNAAAGKQQPGAGDLDIRNLLRTAQSASQGEGRALVEPCASPARLATPDVRIRTAGSRAAHDLGGADVARSQGARTQAPGVAEAAGAACGPSYRVGGAEVLLV
ncbi:unnamed protein product [Prorocentrum cordatum]|uniref:Dynein assembly factor 1, axonemal homolog n=1 Tax=Prorocentrum cordatum TaxID=2364126 RepID=A0ABN9VLJ2_9DINO|nr:unnamed protein product [Polarella glacialis]